MDKFKPKTKPEENFKEMLEVIFGTEEIPEDFFYNREATWNLALSCKEHMNRWKFNEKLRDSYYDRIFDIEYLLRLLYDVTQENIRKEADNQKYVNYVKEILDKVYKQLNELNKIFNDKE